MNPYYDPLGYKDYMMLNKSYLSFADYVTAISSKRRKPKTVKRNNKSKKNRR